jgi:hypothetical protein
MRPNGRCLDHRQTIRPFLQLAEAPVMMLPRNRTFPKPEIRVELVTRVRREIRHGIYESPEKLQIALERLFAQNDLHLEEDSPPSSCQW